MARTSKGVKFVLKNPKAPTSPVKAIFCYSNTQMYYYERKLSIPSKFWNKNSQRAKETSSFEGYTEFNGTLNAIEAAILECYRKFKNDFSKEPTTEELRDLVKVKRGINSGKSLPIEILQFVEQFIEDAKSGKYINQVRGTTISPVTIRTYQQTLILLKAYADYYRLKLRFEAINSTFHKEFNHYLSKIYKSEETGKSLKINTIGKHFTNIKTFMNAALEKKVTTNDSFKNKSFKVIRENVDNIALSEQELNELEKLDLTKIKRLERVRDMFLIGCDTALRISDLKRLKRENLVNEQGSDLIKIEMKKTGSSVAVPITERVKEIIRKYEQESGEFFPKAISDQKANDYIKEIAKKIPLLCENVEINSTENGFRVSRTVPKFELISNHTARRTFATRWALKGISHSIIMRITGHKTEKSFARYIKISELEAAKMFELQTKHLNMKAV